MTMKRRPKGTGSISRLPSGNYRMIVTIGTGLDGKQKRKSVTATTKTELKQKVAELMLHYGKDTTAPKTIKVSYLVKCYMEECCSNLTGSTVDNYRNCIDVVLKHLYKCDIDKVTPRMIDNILDTIRRKNGKAYAPSSIHGFRKRVATFFNYAVRKHWLSVSPVAETKKRSTGDKKADVSDIPNESEMMQLLKEAKEYDATKDRTFPLYPFFLLAVSTGMRLGELLDLRWSDIDMERHTIDISHQCTRREGSNRPLKTRSSYRVIYVSPSVLKAVYGLTRHSECPYLWQVNGRQVTYTTASDVIFRVLQKGKLTHVPKGFTFHSFRHYHATQLLLKGIDIKEVSKRLGHSSIRTTLDLYTHWLPEVDQKASEAVGSQFVC